MQNSVRITPQNGPPQASHNWRSNRALHILTIWPLNDAQTMLNIVDSAAIRLPFGYHSATIRLPFGCHSAAVWKEI
jgi:hypothetical protein